MSEFVFTKVIDNVEELSWWKDWLNKYLPKKWATIGDFLQDKIEKEYKITKNDIKMLKYSSALQFLALSIQYDTGDEISIFDENNTWVQTSKFIVNKVRDNHFADTFLVENEEALAKLSRSK